MSANVRFLVHPGGALRGRLRVPGDKSISHRSIMLGALAEGVTEISGFLEGEDSLATLRAFRQMGVRIEGPRGEFVLDEASRRPLVFLAWGTALAPVKSLIEHATALDAARPLVLYWIASGAGGHYLDNLCRAWQRRARGARPAGRRSAP